MALYWPNEKVALDIVDDPYRNPFEGDESYTVLRVTCQDLCDYDSYKKVMGRLCELLGKEVPSMPDWEENSRILHDALFFGMEDLDDLNCEPEDEASYPFPDYFSSNEPSNVEIVATSEEEGERMRAAARNGGQYVRGVSVWNGPVPKGSFENISDTTRMSTPEYFFLRKSNQLPFAQAVSMGIELCGKYRTSLTQYDRGEGYDFLKESRTSKSVIRRYLRDARGTKEGKRAKRVLRHVVDDCGSPMSCYLYLLTCLPRNQGSYGLERIPLWAPAKTEHGFLPASSGEYLLYDLFWPHKRAAMQFTGDGYPSERDFAALASQDMRVVCVTEEDVQDPERFDAKVLELARLLDAELPEPTDKWLKARARLRRQVEMPTFDHMRLTMRDIGEHRVA